MAEAQEEMDPRKLELLKWVIKKLCPILYCTISYHCFLMINKAAANKKYLDRHVLQILTRYMLTGVLLR